MGVPAFFRWLSKKYPSIVVHSVEEKPCQVIPDEPPVPVDITKPNPNNIEFDNLYLDMNGIIHPCTHPENKPAPKNESEMFVAIFEYMDRLMAICRPRRLLYMAIDGVAPRAKMNQQRSRRFRAAQETREKKEILGRLREEVISRGSYLPPEKKESEYFDSNCITPGTPFMSRLADAIRFYVHKRLHEDSGWRNLQVILSDSNVPGEGEHKIMDFIRRQRGMPDHDPNTRHCLCGADADLIMLGLATHEPHFTIIREEFKPNQPRPCDLCSHFGHEAKNCIGLLAPCDNDREVEDESQSAALGLDTEFIFIRIDILREYLEKDLQMHNLPFPFDLERAIDDWVLMCFFVGNDFLPHLPSLEIRENAIDRLMGLYKKTVYKTNGWLSDSGIVNLNRLALIMQDLGTMEDEIFQRRRSGELNFRKRERQNRGNDRFKRQRAENRPKYAPQSGFCAPTPLLGRDSGRQSHTNPQYLPQSNETAAQALKAMLKEVRMGTDTLSQEASGSRKRKWEEEAPEPTEVAEEEELDEFEKSDRDDVVRLWEGGWRERYYSSKFGVDVKENPEFPSQIAYHYVCGIAWVLSYYYQGCVSWKWYFPFHYAPFASDFSNVDQIKLPFRNYQKGISNVGDDAPFDPLQQLMAVFPADSSDHVPPAWRDLMSDPKSPIIDQYPIRFRVDLNGKRFLWQGVALLPFVDEVRLKAAVAARYHLLTADELKRNERGSDSYFVRSGHPFAALLISESVVKTAETEAEEEIQESRQQIIDPQLTSGISGRYIHLKESEAEQWLHNGRVVTPLPDGTIGYESIVQCQAIQVKYWDPSYSSDHIFQARLLPKVTLPSKILKPRENEHRPDWRPQLGFGPPDSGFRSRMPVNHHPNNQPYAYNPVVAQRMVQRSVPWEQPARGWRPPPMAYQQGYGDEHHRSYHQDSRNYDYPQYYPPRPRGFPPGDRFYQPRRNFRGDRHY